MYVLQKLFSWKLFKRTPCMYIYVYIYVHILRLCACSFVRSLALSFVASLSIISPWSSERSLYVRERRRRTHACTHRHSTRKSRAFAEESVRLSVQLSLRFGKIVAEKLCARKRSFVAFKFRSVAKKDSLGWIIRSLDRSRRRMIFSLFSPWAIIFAVSAPASAVASASAFAFRRRLQSPLISSYKKWNQYTKPWSTDFLIAVHARARSSRSCVVFDVRDCHE